MDLSSKMGPVRDQGDISLCHAYAAADLLSFKTGVRISATSLAVHSESNIPPTKLLFKTSSERLNLGGNIKTTLESGLRKGLCSEENLPSEYSTNKNLRSSLPKFIEESEQRTKLINGMSNFSLPVTQNKFNIGITSCNEEIPQNLLAMKQIQTLIKIRDAVLTNSTANNLFKNMEEKACNKNRIFPKVSIVNVYNPKVEMIAAIDDQLNGNAPAGIEYFSGFLFNKIVDEDDDGHASTVIGRTLNPDTNKCEYLIRNSWGTSCANIQARYRCHKGNYWVSRDDLHRILNQVTYIK